MMLKKHFSLITNYGIYGSCGDNDDYLIRWLFSLDPFYVGELYRIISNPIPFKELQQNSFNHFNCSCYEIEELFSTVYMIKVRAEWFRKCVSKMKDIYEPLIDDTTIPQITIEHEPFDYEKSKGEILKRSNFRRCDIFRNVLSSIKTLERKHLTFNENMTIYEFSLLTLIKKKLNKESLERILPEEYRSFTRNSISKVLMWDSWLFQQTLVYYQLGITSVEFGARDVVYAFPLPKFKNLTPKDVNIITLDDEMFSIPHVTSSIRVLLTKNKSMDKIYIYNEYGVKMSWSIKNIAESGDSFCIECFLIREHNQFKIMIIDILMWGGNSFTDLMYDVRVFEKIPEFIKKSPMPGMFIPIDVTKNFTWYMTEFNINKNPFFDGVFFKPKGQIFNYAKNIFRIMFEPVDWLTIIGEKDLSLSCDMKLDDGTFYKLTTNNFDFSIVVFAFRFKNNNFDFALFTECENLLQCGTVHFFKTFENVNIIKGTVNGQSYRGIIVSLIFVGGKLKDIKEHFDYTLVDVSTIDKWLNNGYFKISTRKS